MVLTHTNDCGHISFAPPPGCPHSREDSAHTPRRGVLEGLAIKEWAWAFIGQSDCQSCVSWPAVSAQHFWLSGVSLLVPLSGPLPGLPHLHLPVRRLNLGVDDSGWFQHYSTSKAASFSFCHRQLWK